MHTLHDRQTHPEMLLIMLLTLAAILLAQDPMRPHQFSAFGYYVGHQLE